MQSHVKITPCSRGLRIVGWKTMREWLNETAWMIKWLHSHWVPICYLSENRNNKIWNQYLSRLLALWWRVFDGFKFKKVDIYVFLNFMTARILAPTYNKCGICFCGKKKGPCRVLNWFWLICYMLILNNINYAILYYSNLHLAVYNAYISLQKSTNRMVKHITRSHFLGIFL